MIWHCCHYENPSRISSSFYYFQSRSVAPSFAPGERDALVRGNAKYPDAEAPLKEPINDARDIAEELKRDGFNVDIGENLTAEQMRRAFERLTARSNRAPSH